MNHGQSLKKTRRTVPSSRCHGCKKTFYVFFFIFQTIFLFLNVGKVQSDKQVN